MLGDTVEIVVTTYNGEKYIKEQMDSLLFQTHENIVISVYDDGSEDATIDILKDYVSADPRVRVVQNKENKGYVKNFIDGIKQARAPYIMCADQDDVWNDVKVERTLARMIKAEKIRRESPIMVFTDAMLFDDETGEDKGSFQKNSHYQTKKVDMAHLLMENKCIGCTVMVNSAIQPYLLEYPDEIRSHDWWMALICRAFGGITYMDEMTLRYRQHSDNQIGGMTFISYIKDRIKDLGRQREAIRSTFRQGRAFYEMFGDKLESPKSDIVTAFSDMEDDSYITKRVKIMRYGFKKSGFIRNLGLFLIV